MAAKSAAIKPALQKMTPPALKQGEKGTSGIFSLKWIVVSAMLSLLVLALRITRSKKSMDYEKVVTILNQKEN